MKQNYKITLQYEGTRYDGWQKQGNTSDTIQGKIEAILQKMTGKEIEIHGSGRTDAGAHATGQVANFFLKKDDIVEPKVLKEYLNRYLPEDIAVLTVEHATDRFHSRLNATKKVYVYQIEMGEKRDVFARRMQYGLGQRLNVKAMKEAAILLCGTQDYMSFCGNKKLKKASVRTIESIAIKQEATVVTLTFTGNGFLQHMVRIMTGTLIEVGMGKRTPQSMTEILGALNRQEAGFTAPAEGLNLSSVLYE